MLSLQDRHEIDEWEEISKIQDHLPSLYSLHAAARPVESAVRCERKILGCLNLRIAYKVAFKGNHQTCAANQPVV